MNIDLTHGDIGKHIKKLAIPSSVGFFFHTMYNVTDTYFAGQISTQALSALTLSFSIFFMMLAFAIGMSEAVTAQVGNALGEKDEQKAIHISMNALLFSFILSIVLTLVGVLSTPSLMGILGAEGGYLEESLAYINIILYGSVFFVVSYFINALLNAVGDTVSFRNILIVSAFLNIVLDYWFVYGGLGLSPLGVRGISFATVVTEAITAAYLFYKLKKTPLIQHFKSFSLDVDVFKELTKQGFPPSINMIMMATGIFIITYYVAPFGKEVVAAFGVGMRIEQIVLMPTIGLNVAALAIISQNNGAQAFDRIEETIRTSLYYGGVLSLAGMLILLGGAEELMRLFSDDVKVIEEGVIYLYVEAFIIFFFVMIFVYLAMLQGIEKPGFIFYISIFRQVVAPIIVLSTFSMMGLDVVWVWIGIALIVTFSALVTWKYSRKKLEEVSGRFDKNITTIS
jgi:putative MATE family efflux protein